MSRDWDGSPWACGGGVATKSLRRCNSSCSSSTPNKKIPPQIIPPPHLRPKASKRLRQDKWRAAFDSEGKPVGFRKLLKGIIAGGVEHSIRPEVWEFLLGCYGLGTTSVTRQRIRQARRQRYKELIQECQSMHASVGTGSLAYTVGSKVMDVRIISKDTARKEAKLGLERISLDLQAHSEAEGTADQQVKRAQTPKNTEAYVELEAFFEFSEDFGSRRMSEEAGGSGPLYSMSSPSAHDYEAVESEMSDFSFTNGDNIAEFPYLPSINLFMNVNKGRFGNDERSPDEGSGRGEAGSFDSPGSRRKLRRKFPEREQKSTLARFSGLLGLEEGNHAMFEDHTPIKFDKEPPVLHLDADSDVLGSSFREAAVFNLEVATPETPKSAANGECDFPYPVKREVTEERVADWLWTLHKIVVDVVRTDRHLEFYGEAKNMARMSDILAVYAWIDSATGYCQGMSDLLSPFIVLFDDDADAFWCFESLLRRVRQNFQMEGPIGVMKQLDALSKILELTDLQVSRHFSNVGADDFLFAFRMLLVLFRRELSFGESLYMWEMMWAADFDQAMANSMEVHCPEALVIRSPSMSLQERMREDDHKPVGWRLNGISPCGSPRENGNDHGGLNLLAKSPFCGLGPSIWVKPRQKSLMGGVGVEKKGDEELSVFCVAAILVLNRSKLLKEVQCMDDAIKMFNDLQLTIRVQKCIQTAIRLRKRYRNQLGKRPVLKRSASGNI